METVVDKLGQPLAAGSYIAYGHALGRCAGLRIGKVLAVKSAQVKRWHTDKSETEYRITVQGVDDDWHYDDRGPVLCSRKGTLLFPSRIVVLAEHVVPQQFLDLLKDL